MKFYAKFYSATTIYNLCQLKKITLHFVPSAQVPLSYSFYKSVYTYIKQLDVEVLRIIKNLRHDYVKVKNALIGAQTIIS